MEQDHNKQNGKPIPRRIESKQFLRHFGEQSSRRFCFILGAGASKSSGIPTGAELARRWLDEIKEDLDNEQFESWCKAERIDQSEPANFYPKIFAKRFEVDHQGGYDFLEEIMEKAEPSCGYSFLAEIMSRGKHDVVITTNFDSLTEDALFIYTSKKPLIIGHSELAGFINIRLQRPQVIKVHHDLFLSPQNTESETSHIPKKLESGLKDIFSIYTPVVIGYGGNDGGFMEVLRDALGKNSGLFWCLRGTELPKDEIIDLVVEKRGRFIPIEGFDELMVSLGQKIGIGLLHEKIEQVARERVERYRNQVEETIKNMKSQEVDILPDVWSEIIKFGKREESDWWPYALQAMQETDEEKKEARYKEGLEKYPDNPLLINHYAAFLADIKKDYLQAEQHFQKALKLAPNDPYINGSYANLLRIRRDYLQAEQYFRKALELAPNDPTTNRNYANFSLVQKDYPQAKKYLQKALELAPNEPNTNDSYAILFLAQKDYSQAEKYFQKALELAPNEPNFNGNYALLLLQQELFDQAGTLIHRAFQHIQTHEKNLELELWFYRYACFFQDYPESKARIKKLLKEGVRSPGWLLEGLLETAKVKQHPEYDQVAEFIKQICET